MQTYIVIGNGSLKHDSTYYEPGATVVLTEEQAAPLLALGKLETTDKAASAEVAPADNPGVQADGFPDHSVENKTSEVAPAAAPSQPDAGEQVPPKAPATNPTAAQIAKDLEEIK